MKSKISCWRFVRSMAGSSGSGVAWRGNEHVFASYRGGRTRMDRNHSPRGYTRAAPAPVAELVDAQG